MDYGARPLRSTRRLQNIQASLPRWYSITNAASVGLPTQVSIYDEIGVYGVSAGEFMADLKGVNGDIELHINSPGGDVFDGIAIYNQLKQRAGTVHVVVDSLAASAASFIAQAASPGKLEIAPHAQFMIHKGFAMSYGDDEDMLKTAQLLRSITGEIASIYAERTGKPADYWLAKMTAETWFTDKEAVAEGLADRILGQDTPKADWDLSVYAKVPGGADAGQIAQQPAVTDAVPVVLNADGNHAPMSGTHSHGHTANGDQGDDDTHDHEHTHDNDADHGHSHADPDADEADQAEETPPKVGNAAPADVKAALAGMFPVLAAEVDSSPWDASKAWAAGAASDDPEAFYRGICAGRKAGDPDTQDAWALPYKYSPSSAPNAAGVANALSRLPQTKGLTNKAEAESKLQGLMKQVNPDYDPDALADAALLASVLHFPAAEVDTAEWDAGVVLKAAMSSADPAWYFRQICAGRLPGDPATPDAWALPYRRNPSAPPNASAVATALAELPHTAGLVNRDEARSVLDKARKGIAPDPVPDDEIDPDLLVAAFALGLKGAGK